MFSWGIYLRQANVTNYWFSNWLILPDNKGQANACFFQKYFCWQIGLLKRDAKQGLKSECGAFNNLSHTAFALRMKTERSKYGYRRLASVPFKDSKLNDFHFSFWDHCIRDWSQTTEKRQTNLFFGLKIVLSDHVLIGDRCSERIVMFSESL